MSKTILKLHANGDLETVGTPLVVLDSHNLFDISTSIQGYLFTGSGLATGRTGNMESYSAPIPVAQGKYTLQVWWDQPSVPVTAFSNAILYTSSLTYVRGSKVETQGLQYYKTVIDVPSNVSFMRISVSFFDEIAKVQLTKGDITLPYNLSKIDTSRSNLPTYSFNENKIIVPEIVEYSKFSDHDRPEWALDTGNPISFFKEGIVIKGNLIQS